MGLNGLKSFEKLIGIVHNRALEAASNAKGGIIGMNGANDGFKLQDGDKKSTDAGACGC